MAPMVALPQYLYVVPSTDACLMFRVGDVCCFFGGEVFRAMFSSLLLGLTFSWLFAFQSRWRLCSGLAALRAFSCNRRVARWAARISGSLFPRATLCIATLTANTALGTYWVRVAA